MDQDNQINVETAAQDDDDFVDTSASTGANDEAGGEEHESAERAPKPFRAWELPEVETKQEPAHIPYGRFREVNEERKALEAQLSTSDARIAELTARLEELNAIKSPDDIKIEDYDDPQEYLKARDKAIKAAAVKEIEERWIAREQEKERQHQLIQIDTAYKSNVAEAVKRNPEIQHAVNFLDKHGEHLHPAVAYELMTDPNIGELALQITTNPQLLRAVFTADPQQVVRAIQRLSGRIDALGTSKSKDTDADAETPSIIDQISAAVPTKLRSTPVATRKDPSKMTSAQYRAYVERNRKGKR